ncbi:MAG: hypothetical protein KDA87_04525 [Planctomycetales bacterium]|nr:hypothetical protein [Planctomycetales bacterium]
MPLDSYLFWCQQIRNNGHDRKPDLLRGQVRTVFDWFAYAGEPEFAQ